MRNTFGNNVTVTLFGESHGEAVGAVLDGMRAGIKIDLEFIKSQLNLRKPVGDISTSRVEEDDFKILSGVFEGYTTGAPICIIIPNENTKSKDYSEIKSLARPSHADYVGDVKYKGFNDYRGGGHFSGRVTAALVAVGAIAISFLKERGISIGTHISRCAGIDDASFCDLEKEINLLNQKQFAVINDEKGKFMVENILKAKAEGDSVGGILETAITGLSAGLGEPWFDSVESMLSHALFSIPAIKGVEFGVGFRIADMTGSTANDAFYMDNGTVKTKTNNNGGINGGITNGMPVIFRCAVKPTPTIIKKQNTVDFKNKEDAVLQAKGRHDPCIIHRARVVVDSMTALVICDLLSSGAEW